MKKSEKLKQQASEEDNDFKSFNLLCKSFRESRSQSTIYRGLKDGRYEYI